MKRQKREDKKKCPLYLLETNDWYQVEIYMSVLVQI